MNHSVDCPYCAGATTNSVGNVYCSKRGENINDPENSLFSFKSSNVDSDPHYTRLTLRFVTSGTQHYIVGRNKKLLQPGRYLLINHGQQYRTIMPPGELTTMLGVAFKPSYVVNFFHDLTHSENDLLDNPFLKTNPLPSFYEGTFEADMQMQRIIKSIERILKVKPDWSQKDILNSLYANVLTHLFRHQTQLLNTASQITCSRSSTAHELYRRLIIARDYMEASYNSIDQMSEVARVACLSEFHFMRSFRQAFKVTPYQYVLSLRMKNARLLLLNSSKPINEISFETGFTDAGNFSRLFRKTYAASPLQMRNQN